MPFFRVHSVVPIASLSLLFFTGEPFNTTSSEMSGSFFTLSSNGLISEATTSFKTATNSASVGIAKPSFAGEFTVITAFFAGS